MFSTRSKTGHKSGKWVIWTRLEVEGELNGVVWRWIWSHACGLERLGGAGLGLLSWTVRFGLAGWSRASGLVKLGCVWAGPYLCGPESRVHAGRGSQVGWTHESRVGLVWACRLLGRVVGLTRLLCADWAR